MTVSAVNATDGSKDALPDKKAPTQNTVSGLFIFTEEMIFLSNTARDSSI